MKTLLTIALFILLSSAAIAQYNTTVEKQGLKGKVKTVETFNTSFLRKDGKDVPLGRQPFSIRNFDSNGNLTEEAFNGAGGKMYSHHIYTYNRDGKLTDHSYYRNGNIFSRDVYVFDERGRNTGCDEYSNVNGKILTVPQKHIYTLDEKGNKIELQLFKTDGSPGLRFIYKYNEQGKLIEQIDYFYRKQFEKAVHKYDERGNETSLLFYDYDGKLIAKTVTTYNSRGRKTEELRYEKEHLQYRNDYKYDHKGRILEEKTTRQDWKNTLGTGKTIYIYNDRKRTQQISRYTPDGKLLITTLITFNIQGDAIKRVMSQRSDYAAGGVGIDGVPPGKTSDPSSMITQEYNTEYAYDAKGNWTRIFYLNPPAAAPSFNLLVERIITYY